jgi:hypothetical protein
MRGNDVADCIGHSALQRERDSGKGMTQSLAALALVDRSVWAQFVLQQLPHIREDRSRNHRVQVDRKCASHKLLHCFGTVACNVHHTALVFHEGDWTVRDQQGEWNPI